MIGSMILDRYRVDTELGKGGMGIVYRAFDTLLERDVAIKVLSEGGLSADSQLHLLEEARAAAGLSHPNIVMVYDVGEFDGSLDAFNASIDVLEDLGSRLETGRTYYQRGRMRDLQDKHEEAKLDLQTAQNIFQECGAKLDIKLTKGILG